jgi:hypothetical protein
LIQKCAKEYRHTEKGKRKQMGKEKRRDKDAKRPTVGTFGAFIREPWFP